MDDSRDRPELGSSERADGDGQRRKPRSARRPLIVLGVLAAAMALAIGIYLFVTRNEESTDDAQVGADLVDISPQISGRVKRVAVTENQQVRPGDVLVEIDDVEFSARVRQATAELQIARAQADAAEAQVRIALASSRGGLSSAEAMVAESSRGVTEASAQIAAARAAVLRAQAEAERTGADYRRAAALRRSLVISQEALDQRTAAHDSAQAALDQARAQLRAAEASQHVARSRVAEASGKLQQSRPVEAQIAAARAGLDLANARVDSKQSALELARLQLSYTRILAPASGVTSKITGHVGELVQPGQLLMVLVPDRSYLVANFKETQIGRMRPGQSASATIDALGGRKLWARVESLSGGTGASFALIPPDNASGNFVKVVQRVPVRLVWVDLPSNLTLQAGLSAEVTVYFR